MIKSEINPENFMYSGAIIMFIAGVINFLLRNFNASSFIITFAPVYIFVLNKRNKKSRV